jgi:hypothetical protein
MAVASKTRSRVQGASVGGSSVRVKQRTAFIT